MGDWYNGIVSAAYSDVNTESSVTLSPSAQSGWHLASDSVGSGLMSKERNRKK